MKIKYELFLISYEIYLLSNSSLYPIKYVYFNEYYILIKRI